MFWFWLLIPFGYFLRRFLKTEILDFLSKKMFEKERKMEPLFNDRFLKKNFAKIVFIEIAQNTVISMVLNKSGKG